METIYRKVAIEERLPQEKTYVGIVNTLGDVDTLFYVSDGKFSVNHVAFLNSENDRTYAVKFWLEEIPQTIKSDNTEVILNLQKDKEEFLHFMKYFMQSLENEDFIMINNTDEDVVDNLLSKFNSLIQKHKQ